MDKKKQNRELTYNEAKALLQNMYSRGDNEVAKELWNPSSQKQDNQNNEHPKDNENPVDN